MNSLVTYWVLSVVVVMGLSYGLYRAAPCVLVVIAALGMNLVSMLMATVRAGGSPTSRLIVIAALYACSAV